jgi:hypothetical protein
MPSVHTAINISAPPSVVRQIFLDFPSYSQWNPFIISIKCNNPSAAPGSRLQVKTLDNGFESTILENKPDNFNWQGMMAAEWIFKGNHIFKFEPLGDIGENGETVGCKFIQDEVFGGILASLVMFFYRQKLEKGFNDMNAALKSKAEGIPS